MTVKVCCGCGWGRDLRVRQSAQRDGSCWSAPSPDPQSRIWWPVARPWNRGHTPLASAGLYFLGGLCSPTTRPLNHYYLPRRRRSVLLYTPCNQIFFRLMIRKTAKGSFTDAISWTVLWEIVRKKKFGIDNLKYIFWSIISTRVRSIKKYKFLKSTRVFWDDGATP